MTELVQFIKSSYKKTCICDLQNKEFDFSVNNTRISFVQQSNVINIIKSKIIYNLFHKLKYWTRYDCNENINISDKTIKNYTTLFQTHTSQVRYILMNFTHWQ